MNQKHKKIYIDSVTNNRQHQYNHILIKKQRILKVNEYELKTNILIKKQRILKVNEYELKTNNRNQIKTKINRMNSFFLS